MELTRYQVDTFACDYLKLSDAIGSVFFGKAHVVDLVVAALFAKTHVLLEDVPGTGKTHLAKALAGAIQGVSKRIQFTPDLLPTDIIGVQVYEQATKQFVFHEGAIFANIVLADEINRASPKTQSGMLEVMEEQQATIDTFTRNMLKPFFVIATQNPIEQAGTYPLPEAQLDRFGIKTSIGYLNQVDALKALALDSDAVTNEKGPPKVLDIEKVCEMQSLAKGVHCEPSILNYILDIVNQTREHPSILAGVSQRGAKILLQIAKVWALKNTRSYVLPDDIKDLVIPCFNHRLILTQDARFEGVSAEEILRDIIVRTKVPRG